MGTHSSILAWEIPWTGGLQSTGSQRHSSIIWNVFTALQTLCAPHSHLSLLTNPWQPLIFYHLHKNVLYLESYSM